MHQKQQQQQQAHDHNTDKLRSFLPGDAVAVRLFRGQEKWAQGEVIQRLGPVSYMVRINNKVSHVHIDHLVVATETASCSATHSWQRPLPEKTTTTLDPRVQMRNPAHTLHLTGPEMLPPVPEADASRTADRGSRHTCHGVEAAGERPPGWRQPQPRSRRGPAQDDATLPVLGGLPRALTVPVTDKAECAERQS